VCVGNPRWSAIISRLAIAWSLCFDALMRSRVDIPKRFSLARLPSAAVLLDHLIKAPSLSVVGTDTAHFNPHTFTMATLIR